MHGQEALRLNLQGHDFAQNLREVHGAVYALAVNPTRCFLMAANSDS